MRAPIFAWFRANAPSFQPSPLCRALGPPRRLCPHLLLVSAAVALPAAFDHQVGRPQDRPPAKLPSFDVVEQTIPELQRALEQGVITSRGLVEIYLARIRAYDRQGPQLNAILTLNPGARAEADALDRERASKRLRGPLHGIPILVKDNFDVAGLPTTAGSVAFADLVPIDDAFQVKKLRQAGAVVIGKTNMHELASGITTISSLGGQTRNPYDPARNPGGSSGGTGAAVAASFAAAGLGSDTCGSIRIPAAHNNLFGLRPTIGLSSRDGVMPLSSTQDVAGPLARTVTDLALLLDATAGVDPADPATRVAEGRIPPSYAALLSEGALKGARIGVLRSYFGTAPEDEEVAGILRKALEAMKARGAEVFDVSIPGLDELLRGSSVIDHEFKFDLQAYLAAVPRAPVSSLDEIVTRGLVHQAVEGSARRRAAVERRDSDEYRRALIKREALRHAVDSVVAEHRLDALAYPTVRRKPAPIGEPQRGSTCQLSASTGLPALTMPAGFTPDELPVGLELLGPAFSEARLLAIGYAFEQATRFRRPPFSTPPLVNGQAPPPLAFEARGASARFSYDPPTATLRYDVALTGVPAGRVAAVTLHRGGPGQDGPSIARLVEPGRTTGTGSIQLAPADQRRLRDGQLHVLVFLRGAAPLRHEITQVAASVGATGSRPGGRSSKLGPSSKPVAASGP